MEAQISSAGSAPSAVGVGRIARRPAITGRRGHSRFYLAVTLILFAIVVRGFWPTYFGPLLRGGVVRPWIIHLHGAVFVGWMVLLLAQVALVATGRVRAHRRVGNAGIAYGALVLGLGLLVSFAAPVLHIRAGEWTVDEAAAFLLLPLVDMVLFAGFFGAAIAWRRKPETHKRLILAATVALAFAAVARMFETLLPIFLLWLAPMFAAMAYDRYSRGRVHPVYFASVAIMMVAFVRLLFMETEGWLRIGRWLLAPFGVTS